MLTVVSGFQLKSNTPELGINHIIETAFRFLVRTKPGELGEKADYIQQK